MPRAPFPGRSAFPSMKGTKERVGILIAQKEGNPVQFNGTLFEIVVCQLTPGVSGPGSRAKPACSAPAPGAGQPQDVEMTAPAMDFYVKGGRQLERAVTSGPPQIVITQPGSNQKTVVIAKKFTAKMKA